MAASDIPGITVPDGGCTTITSKAPSTADIVIVSASSGGCLQHTVNRRGDQYTYFFCRNRQQGNCRAPYVNVADAEQAVEHYCATISQQRVTNALAAPTTGEPATNDPGRFQDSVERYRACTDDQRRLVNHAIFYRLCLADGNITSHEPRSAAA